LTREPSKADQLKSLGAEIFVGDASISTPENIARLRSFFEGCNAAFIVTQFWQYFQGHNGEQAGLLEVRDGKNLVDAAKLAGVKTLIISSLDNVRIQSNGKYDVPHFDFKNVVEQYARSLIPHVHAVYYAMYMENYLGFIAPTRNQDGSYSVIYNTGDSKISLISVADAGWAVKGIFDALKAGKKVEKVIGLESDYISGAEISEAISKQTKATVRFIGVPDEQYMALGSPGAVEMGNMLGFYRLYGDHREGFGSKLAKKYCPSGSPGLRSFKQWLADVNFQFSN
jgi:hypothetical protein